MNVRHYFVDEAGDPNLFGRRGKVIIGTEGCSRFFILGYVDIPDIVSLSRDLETLREELLQDPYFRDVPSLQPNASKTVYAFHAKDDIQEVRYRVFSILKRHEDVRFFAVVRDKLSLLDYVRQRGERDASYRYNANELYDFLVRQLFKTTLHKDDEYRICFASRGKSDRTAALEEALINTRDLFISKTGIRNAPPLYVTALSPKQSVGLQVADYFLWALQRAYERLEDRYLTYLWPSFRLVIDLDDRRSGKGYGEYYTQRKPLTRAALNGRL